MNPQDAIDFSREAIKTCMMIGGPVLLASLIIGLLVGVFQAMTQVQDQTVSFVPKILLLIVTISLMLPWCTDHLLDFAKLSFEKPMTNWSNMPIESSSPPSENQVAPTTPTSQVRIAKASFPMAAPTNPAPQPGANVPAKIQNSPSQFSMPTMKNSDTTKTSMPTLQPRPEFNFELETNESGTTSPFKLPRFQQEPKTPSNDSNG